MKTNEQITKEIYQLARKISDTSSTTPYIAILQPRRTFKEIPAQQLLEPINRMIDLTGMTVSFHAIDGNPVDVADNWLIDKALEDNAKYALFIEEDTVLPSYGAVRLLETSKQFPDAIIVGVYYVKFGGPMLSQADEENRWFPIDATPNTGLRRNIAGCGLGCTLIPMHLIKRMKEKFKDIPLFITVPKKCWGDEEIKDIGQDNWFYNLVKMCGIEVIADTSVQCLHMELATGKYTAHPDVKLSDYLTNIPISTPLTLEDRNRVSVDYVRRMQHPEYVNSINSPIKDLVIDYSDETKDKVIECLNNVKTAQNFYEVARLCERVKKLQPKRILEIGVENGGTMNLWLNFSPEDSSYIGIDKDIKFVTPMTHKQNKILIEADSNNENTLKEVKKIWDSIDFLFIDGGHDYDTVKSDFEKYGSLVKKGGIIAFHDIDVSSNKEVCEGVKKLWSEIKNKYNTEEFINTETSVYYGIGIINV